MAIFSFLQRNPQRKAIQTSRPIFQHSSSFLTDDDDLQKPTPAVLPFFHRHNHPIEPQQPSHSKESCYDSDDPKDLINPLPKPNQRVHLILHTLNLIFTVVSLTLLITVIPVWNSNFQHTTSLIRSDYTDGLVLGPLLLSLFTSTYLLVTQYTSLRHHLHPRLVLATSNKPHRNSTTSPTISHRLIVLLSLTVLLTLTPTLVLSGSNSLALTWRSPQPNRAGVVVCNLVNMFTRECQPILYQVGGLQIGGVATGGMVGVLWLLVCGVAVRDGVCEQRERERLRRERRRERHVRRRNRGHAHTHAHTHTRGRGHRRGQDRKHERKNGGGGSDGGGERGEKGRPRRTGSDLGSEAGGSEKSSETQHARPQQHGMNGRHGYEPVYALQGGNQPWDGSAAVQMTEAKVRPQETIQVWLNSRYA